MDRLRDMLGGRERDIGASEAATAVSSALRVWRNEIAEENAHNFAEAVNQIFTRVSDLEDRMNTRLDAQDEVLTIIRMELQGGVKEMQVGFETVVERQFIKEQLIKGLSAQLRSLAIQIEQAHIHGEPPPPDVVREMYQAAAQLQEVVAAA